MGAADMEAFLSMLAKDAVAGLLAPMKVVTRLLAGDTASPLN
jgi:hypothetical protein